MYLPNHLKTRLQNRYFTSLIILLTFGIHSLFAQNGNIKFEHLGQENGLNHPSVRKIVQDKQGFMWFGTPDGVGKYDGYTFTRYRHDPADTNSLAANSINDMYVDRSGTLWVGSFDGLNCYNRARDCFIRYQYGPEDTTSILTSYVSAIGEDGEGTLWVGSSIGISSLKLENRNKKIFTRYRPSRGNLTGLNDNQVTCIAQDPRPNSKAVWIGTLRGGLNKFDPNSGGFSHIFRPHPNFQWMREQYSPKAIKLIESLAHQRKLFQSIIEAGDSLHLTKPFEVSQEKKVLVMGIGEGWQGKMYDFGWLESVQTGDTLWQMEFDKALHAGGHSKNRLQIAILNLAPGKYILHYQTDENHSYPKWNSAPPKKKQFWGIQLYSISDEDEAAFNSIRENRFMPEFISHNRIRSLYAAIDPIGEDQYTLWVGTDGGGLNRLRLPIINDSLLQDNPRYYDFENVKITRYEHDSANPFSLNSNYVYSIFKSRLANSNKLWVGTANGGLSQLVIDVNQSTTSNIHLTSNLEQKDTSQQPTTLSPKAAPKFIHYTNDPSNPNSLSSNSVYTIHEDHSGNLWAGTSAGLNKLSQRKLHFRHYTKSHDPQRSETSLPHSSVRAIFEDKNDIVWLGTNSGGISKFDPASGKFTYYGHVPGNPNSASRAATSVIREDPNSDDGHLWLGTFGGGLSRFNKRNGKFTHFRANRQDTSRLTANSINDLQFDSSGNLWIATEGGGVNKFDPQTGKVIKRYLGQPHPDSAAVSPNYLGATSIWALQFDPYSSDPVLWIGTVGSSLSQLNLRNDKFTHYVKDEDQPGNINNRTVTAIYIDQSQTLWVGTYSGGLNKFDRNSGTFTHYTVHNGLSNNMVCGILEDDFGNLWLSTNSGLSNFNPKSEVFKNYDVNDGLQSDLFYRSAFFKSRSGKMFFGGVNGFTCFHPDSLKENLHQPQIVITDFKIFDKSVVTFWANDHYQLQDKGERPFAPTVSKSRKMLLDYTQNFFSFEFVALDYTNPPKNEYAYQLVGFDSDWVYCGTRRYASYTNLDPGEYTFRVKGANSDGVWNETGVAINIVITPPFWKTWWFYAISIIALISLAIAFHNHRVRVKINRMVEIERVRKKAAADFHDELGHKLTKISLFSEILRRKINGTATENLDYINRINDISNTLYHGMRDFLWTLDPEKDSLYEVAVRLKDFGDEFFDKTGISFHATGIDRHLKRFNLTMDWKRHIILIFKEGMNNILKHSNGENVLLEIDLKGDMLKITLSDDGVGLMAESTHYANGKNEVVQNGGFRNSNSKTAYTGNGIKNMKNRAAKLGCDLIVHNNNERKGAIVEFIGRLC